MRSSISKIIEKISLYSSSENRFDAFTSAIVFVDPALKRFYLSNYKKYQFGHRPILYTKKVKSISGLDKQIKWWRKVSETTSNYTKENQLVMIIDFDSFPGRHNWNKQTKIISYLSLPRTLNINFVFVTCDTFTARSILMKLKLETDKLFIL